MPFDLPLVQKLAVWALPILFALTLREVAHGWTAFALGDRTALMLGRLSFNPIKHVDPIGTLAVPLLMVMLGGFVFGWAKPMPISARNFKHPRRGMALVAAAGPTANFLMALAWGLLLKLALAQQAQEGMWLGMQTMALAGVSFNLIIGVISLLPIPPLDGGLIVNGLLPSHASAQYERLTPYGFYIVLAILMIPQLSQFLNPPLALAHLALFSLLGIEA